jgi:hypothetical protein
LGIRGTEFEAVVSLDATSAITVDEGRIEVEAEDQKILLNKGEMAEVEVGVELKPPVPAIPKEKRDWRAWRRKRVRRLFQNLPQMAPRFRNRFEKAVVRSKRFTDRVKEDAETVKISIDKVRRARKERNRQRAVQSIRQLRIEVQHFKKLVARFRKGLNRIRVMGRLSHKVERFVNTQRERFSQQDLTRIERELALISQKRDELRKIYRPTVIQIRRTFKELKKLRREIRTVKLNQPMTA